MTEPGHTRESGLAALASYVPRRAVRGLVVAAAAAFSAFPVAAAPEEIAVPAEIALAAEIAAAAEIVEVSLDGHESLSTRDLADVLGVAKGSSFDERRLAAGIDSLVAILASRGRPFALVTADWDSVGAGVLLRVEVDEGAEVRVGDVVLDGVDRLSSSRPPERLDTRTGRALTGASLASDAESLLDDLAEHGHPFAEVVMPRFVDVNEAAEVSLRVAVRPGIRAVFGDVVVDGNTATRDYVIVRETGIRTGTPYRASKLDRARASVERLGFLESVSEPIVAVDPESGEATVGLTVEEGASSSITGVLGYAGTGSDESEITGLVDVRLGNIAGTGRGASAAWERIRENETAISFSYTEPWLLGAPIDVGVAGRQAVRDTFYTTTEADLFVTARMGDRVRLTWSLGGERYVPGAEDESTTTSTRTAFGATFDGSDVPANPTTGTRLSGHVEYAAKEYADTGGDATSGTITLSADRFLRVRPRQVLALSAGLSAMASTEDEVPFHELLVLGGARSLRGYREEQFRGTRTALGTVEYRFILSRRSRAVAFVDAGYYYRPGANFAKDTKLGYGIGLRGETRLGTIAIDYGLGEGDRLLDGKLHAGIIREF